MSLTKPDVDMMIGLLKRAARNAEDLAMGSDSLPDVRVLREIIHDVRYVAETLKQSAYPVELQRSVEQRKEGG